MGRVLTVERKDEEVVLRFKVPEILPSSTREHSRAATRETLLALRDLADKTIDRAIEFVEKREEPEAKGKKKIEVE